MARRETLLDLLDRLAPDVRDAFVQSIARVTGQVQLRALEDAIARGDVNAVLQMLDLDRSYFAPLDRAFSDAYVQAGDWTMEELARQAKAQGVKVFGFFDGRNVRAERFLTEQSSRLITGPDGLMDDIRENVRRVLTGGMEVGTSPRTAALNLVGRINRATGRREGGVIGLSARDMEQADSVYSILTDPDGPRSYFVKDRKTGRWKPRYKGTDRQFDSKIIKAIEEGKPLSKADAQAITQRYRNRLLKDRGETIARTELLGSVHHAQNEGLRQMVDSGRVQADAISREWDASEDSATRSSHRALDGEKVIGPDGVFTTINGARMRFPGDRSLGAPGSEIVQCRCAIRTRIDFTKGLRDQLTPEELARARSAMV
jgi:hypothetical protein